MNLHNSNHTKLFALFVFFTLSTPSLVYAKEIAQFKSAGHTLKVLEVAKNLGIPWGMAFLPENQVIVTDRNGSIHLVKLTSGKKTTVTGGPRVATGGQGGLLDVALDPDFKKSKRIYFTYSSPKGSKKTTGLAYGQLHGNRIIGLKEIFVAQPFLATSRHFGSRIVFNANGQIFLSVGDRGNRQFAPDLSSHLGKILRLTKEGKPVSSNPFVDKKNARPEIWSYGHRNPQGLYLDKSGILWEQEHGPRGGDEINIILRGKNYGWPIATYGNEYSGPKIAPQRKPGTVQPFYHYTPSIAPSGLLRYEGNRIKGWKGSVLSGALKLTHLNRLYVPKGNLQQLTVSLDKAPFQRKLQEERFLTKLYQRIRNIKQAPDGTFFLTTDNGLLLKIEPQL